jgi:hypothetical protein
MIIDLFDKLISRCLQLAERREKARKNLLDDFISPIYQEFEVIHNEYIQSFRKYRELIKTSKTQLRKNSPILDLIREDLLFTSGQRTKVIELSRFSNESLDHGFQHYGIGRQSWRRSLIGELEEIFDERWQDLFDPDGEESGRADDWVGEMLNSISERLGIGPNDPNRMEKIKRHQAIQTLDELVENMDGAYGLVTHEFTNLKTELTQL